LSEVRVGSVKMQVDSRRRDVDVPEQDLHHPCIDTAFEQPRCVTVAQAVWADGACDAGGADAETKGAPERVLADGSRAVPVGAQPSLVAMGRPEAAQLCEHRLG